MFPLDIKGFDCFVLKILFELLNVGPQNAEFISLQIRVMRKIKAFEKCSLQENMLYRNHYER